MPAMDYEVSNGVAEFTGWNEPDGQIIQFNCVADGTCCCPSGMNVVVPTEFCKGFQLAWPCGLFYQKRSLEVFDVSLCCIPGNTGIRGQLLYIAYARKPGKVTKSTLSIMSPVQGERGKPGLPSRRPPRIHAKPGEPYEVKISALTLTANIEFISLSCSKLSKAK